MALHIVWPVVLLSLSVLSRLPTAGAGAPRSRHSHDVLPRTILTVVADDFGWNQAGWNNPRAPTPQLTALARPAQNPVFAPRSVRRPLLTLQVSPRSLYRRGKSV